MAITILDTEDPLKIKELQTFYRRAKLVLHPAWSHLLLGFLVWVQNKYLEQKIVATVDQAIKEWEQQVSPPDAFIPPPVYSETGTGFFSEIRLTSPWALPTSSPSGSSPSSSSVSSPGPGSTSSSPSSSS